MTGEKEGIRVRKFAGILERALLGAAMNVVLSIAERRLGRRDRRGARYAPGGR